MRFSGLFLVLVASLVLGAAAQTPKKPAPVPAVKGDPAAGKKLFRIHCSICHFDDVSIVKVGPGMKGLFQLKKMPVSGLPPTEENVRRIIQTGKDEDGMVKMPPYRDVFTPAQMADLLAYLKTR